MKFLALLALVLATPTATSQLPSSGVREKPSGADPAAPEPWLGRVTADIRHEEYGFSPLASGVFSAPNRAQELRSRVSAQGLEVFPRSVDADGEGASWRLALRTRSFGRTDGAFELNSAALEVRGDRVELDHGPLVEWLENRSEGIEQGWTIAARPMGSEPLWIGLELGGDLALRIEEGARSGVLVDACGEAQLRYAGLRAFDATGRELEARLHSGPGGVGIRVEDSEATYPLTVDPLLTNPAWTAESDQADAVFGSTVSPAGDVNGDGYSDVIVGAPAYDNGQSDEGRAFVYHGSASGLASSPAWTAESDQADAVFGVSASTAGDVNGDGYSDVIVGALDYDNGQTNEGRAYVYHGSASGLATSPAWTAESDLTSARFGWSVSTAGDVNGDGYSDVIVGMPLYDNGQTNEGRAYVYHGSASGLATNPAWTAESDQDNAQFGGSVSASGDVNGDGYSDVIVGARFYDNGETDEGRAYVYHGSVSGLAASPAWTSESDQADALFGYSVSTAGDVNGDGYSDVIVGAPYLENGQTWEGRAYLYLGAASGLAASPAWSEESDHASARFGYSVSTAGDVSGDGYSDVIVGAPFYDNGETDEGRAYVYLGAANGLASSPAWSPESDQASARFGNSVATAGDVNGDGYSDVIVGAPFFDNPQTDEGRAYVYHGSAAGLTASPAWAGESNQASAAFGSSVSTAGDVNGDGYSDVIVGAPGYDNGQNGEGRAYVYHGSASGLAASPAWTAESNQAGALFGNSVSTAGDVNGDGYSDVLIGARQFDNGESNEGRAIMYLGSATGLAVSPAWTAESNQVDALFGYSVSTAGDVNGDGYSDVIVGAQTYDNGQSNEGRTFVYLGSASGLATNPAWTAESDQAYAYFGNSVSTAGDVSGDGYSDVIVGAPNFENILGNKGRAYVYHGSASGLAVSPSWTGESSVGTLSSFGNSVSTAGDVNGDGYSDVIIGEPTSDLDSGGQAYVYHGSASGLATSWAWTRTSGQVQDAFGYSVSTAGDVNGDGYSDVLVGAIVFDNGQGDEGRAFVYYGSASGLATSPAWTAESDQAQAWFGVSISTAGDVNGDGYSDVIVGDASFDNGQNEEGRAFLYLGNEGDGGWILAPQQRRLGGLAPIAVLGRSNSPNSFQIQASFERSLAGFTWARPVTPTVRFEWEVEPSLGGTFDGLGIQSGASQAVVGSPLTFDEIVTDLSPNTPYRWRARLRTNNPLLPATPWFSLAGDARTETKVRTATSGARPRRR